MTYKDMSQSATAANDRTSKEALPAGDVPARPVEGAPAAAPVEVAPAPKA